MTNEKHGPFHWQNNLIGCYHIVILRECILTAPWKLINVNFAFKYSWPFMSIVNYPEYCMQSWFINQISSLAITAHLVNSSELCAMQDLMWYTTLNSTSPLVIEDKCCNKSHIRQPISLGAFKMFQSRKANSTPPVSHFVLEIEWLFHFSLFAVQCFLFVHCTILDIHDNQLMYSRVYCRELHMFHSICLTHYGQNLKCVQ